MNPGLWVLKFPSAWHLLLNEHMEMLFLKMKPGLGPLKQTVVAVYVLNPQAGFAKGSPPPRP